jgi:hypothetical protein
MTTNQITYHVTDSLTTVLVKDTTFTYGGSGCTSTGSINVIGKAPSTPITNLPPTNNPPNSVDSTSKIDNIRNPKNYIVGPYPATNAINITADSSGFDAIIIYSLSTGTEKKYITYSNATQATIDVSDLPSGIYLIQIIVDGKIQQTQKIVIER